ncbi:Carboxypeptidase A4 [Allomyces javanicus]|nr:Carboxypeptidase A4 [Allomyces javanicus]
MRRSRTSRRPRGTTLALVAVTALLLVAAVAHAVPLASPDTAAATGAGYAGHQVLRVFLDKHDLASVRSALQGTDIWTDLALTSTYVDVRADAAHAAQLRTTFRTEVLIADVEAAMTASVQPATMDDGPAGPGRNAVDGEVVADAVVAKYGITSTYLGYDTMRAMWDAMAGQWPGRVSVSQVGTSYENRTIAAVKVASGKDAPAGKDAKKTVVVVSGLHAREWIAPAATINIMSNLASTYGTVPRVTALLDAFDFYFVPVVNVDGYEYSMTKDRLWRKNRQPTSSSCIGIDLNRNFPYKWSPPSTTATPCDATYPGSKAGEAMEITALTNWITTLPNLVAFYDLHAYSQLWMYPFGYACNAQPTDAAALAAVASTAQAAMNATGAPFAVGSICSTIYEAAGSSVDWAYAAAKIPFSYAVELRPSANASAMGFLVPPDQIMAAAKETYAGVLASAEAIMARVGNGTVPVAGTATTSAAGMANAPKVAEIRRLPAGQYPMPNLVLAPYVLTAFAAAVVLPVPHGSELRAIAVGTPLPVPTADELLALALATPLPAVDPLESLLARGVPKLVVSPAAEFDQTVFAFPRPLQVPTVVVTECEMPVRDVGPPSARPVQGPIARTEMVERAVARANDEDEAVAWEWTASAAKRSDDAAIEIPSGWVRFDGTTSKDDDDDDDEASVDSEVETDAYVLLLDDNNQDEQITAANALERIRSAPVRACMPVAAAMVDGTEANVDAWTVDLDAVPMLGTDSAADVFDDDEPLLPARVADEDTEDTGDTKPLTLAASSATLRNASTSATNLSPGGKIFDKVLDTRQLVAPWPEPPTAAPAPAPGTKRAAARHDLRSARGGNDDDDEEEEGEAVGEQGGRQATPTRGKGSTSATTRRASGLRRMLRSVRSSLAWGRGHH